MTPVHQTKENHLCCRLEDYEGTGREALTAFDARLDKAAAVLRQAGCGTPDPADPLRPQIHSRD
jgi:hypothetical protein